MLFTPLFHFFSESVAVNAQHTFYHRIIVMTATFLSHFDELAVDLSEAASTINSFHKLGKRCFTSFNG